MEQISSYYKWSLWSTVGQGSYVGFLVCADKEMADRPYQYSIELNEKQNVIPIHAPREKPANFRCLPVPAGRGVADCCRVVVPQKFSRFMSIGPPSWTMQRMEIRTSSDEASGDTGNRLWHNLYTVFIVVTTFIISISLLNLTKYEPSFFTRVHTCMLTCCRGTIFTHNLTSTPVRNISAEIRVCDLRVQQTWTHLFRNYVPLPQINLMIPSCLGFQRPLPSFPRWIYVHYHFKYPLWLTATHMVASYLMAALMIFKLGMAPKNRRILSFKEQVFVVAPFSMLGAASIACGNMALVFLYPSFHEMLQNTTPFWTVVCSMLFVGKRFNNAAYFSLIPVTLGGALCAMGEESHFAIVGGFFVIRLFLTSIDCEDSTHAHSKAEEEVSKSCDLSASHESCDFHKCVSSRCGNKMSVNQLQHNHGTHCSQIGVFISFSAAIPIVPRSAYLYRSQQRYFVRCER